MAAPHSSWRAKQPMPGHWGSVAPTVPGSLTPTLPSAQDYSKEQLWHVAGGGESMPHRRRFCFPCKTPVQPPSLCRQLSVQCHFEMAASITCTFSLPVQPLTLLRRQQPCLPTTLRCAMRRCPSLPANPVSKSCWGQHCRAGGLKMRIPAVSELPASMNWIRWTASSSPTSVYRLETQPNEHMSLLLCSPPPLQILFGCTATSSRMLTAGTSHDH